MAVEQAGPIGVRNGRVPSRRKAGALVLGLALLAAACGTTTVMAARRPRPRRAPGPAPRPPGHRRAHPGRARPRIRPASRAPRRAKADH